MEKENRELLMKDLCARLPYKVRVKQGGYNHILDEINARREVFDSSFAFPKPYLFPISSMTTELKAELSMLVVGVEDIFKSFLIEVEFYHKHHIDYNGLIDKGLAIDATESSIY